MLLERANMLFPKGGYGTPSVVAAAGKALAYFELAVEKDPGCAQAHLALAQAYARFPSWPALPPKERFSKSKDAASRAIELDESLATAHTLLGIADFNLGEWEQAEEEFKNAIDLAPSDSISHASYARFLVAMGHPRKAVSEIEQARKISGKGAASRGSDLVAAEIYYWLRNYDMALKLIQPIAGSGSFEYFLLGWAYVWKSKLKDAITAFEKCVLLSERDSGALMSLAYAYVRRRRRNDAWGFLKEVTEKTKRMYVPIYRVAAVYAAFGHKKQAFAWLERAYREDFTWMVWLKVDPVWDPVRYDPRFQNLLQRMNFLQ
jgi:tetratricopeptide (TPR) repeat protein